MAINSDNLFTEGFRGTVGGNMTFRRKRSGKVIVSKKAKASEIPPTEEQLEIRKRFKRAITYAKAIVKNPEMKATYAARATGDQTALNVALKDAFMPPTVKSIDKSGYKGQSDDTIRIVAEDDFEVMAVKVVIKDPLGELVEQGSAVLEPNGLTWLFTPTMENEQAVGSVITATAYDRAENTGTLEITV